MREEKKLRVENAKLKKEIEELKQELIQAEIQNGGEDDNARVLSLPRACDFIFLPLSLPIGRNDVDWKGS